MSCFLNTRILMFIIESMTRLSQVNYFGFSFKRDPFPRCYSHTTVILVTQKYNCIFKSLCSVCINEEAVCFSFIT